MSNAAEPAIQNPQTAVTERADALERRDPVQTALAAAQVGVWQWDMDAEAFAASPACQAHFGNVADLFEAIHPDDVDMCREALQSGAGFDVWLRVPQQGRTRWVEMRGRGMGGEGARRITGITLDVTEHCNAVGAVIGNPLQCGFTHDLTRSESAAPTLVVPAPHDEVSDQELATAQAEAEDNLTRLKDMIARGISGVIAGRS